MEAENVAVMTLGGQPQIITLLLDSLLRRGEIIHEMIVVHLAFGEQRLRRAFERVQDEFRGGVYLGRPCRFTPQLVTLGSAPVTALDDEDALDAVRDLFAELFATLKPQYRRIHLGLSGGPRLLGYLAMAEAQRQFRHLDRVWHLQTPLALRHQSNDGAIMHSNDPAILPLRVHLNLIAQAPDTKDQIIEYQRCQAVVGALTLSQRAVLQSFAHGRSPDETAAKLHIAKSTVDSHKSAIFEQCRAAWDLHPMRVYATTGYTTTSRISSDNTTVPAFRRKKIRETSEDLPRFLGSQCLHIPNS